MTMTGGQARTGLPVRRIVAALTALIHGALALGLTVLGLSLDVAPAILLVFFLLFGSGCAAALAHAVPSLPDRWSLLQVRPGTVKAVVLFFVGSMHGLVALGALVAIFISDVMWRSVPLFFGSLATYVGVATLFAASGYFIGTLERLAQEERRHDA
ncbi:MAG: hypothetical protein KJN93_04325 [Alphaproteobacteria bacterium]|nr:hypothetical protein [Alphaproteobacteria bacterium]